MACQPAGRAAVAGPPRRPAPAARTVTSKSAVIGLTRALASELGPLGSRVNAITPGSTRTEVTRQTLTDERRRRPADQAATVVPSADVLLVTGTTLLNDTLEGLLGLCRNDARVAVVGPTVSLLPDAYLRRGVDVLGGVRVTAPDAFLDVLSEGGSGYHFFGHSAEKVVLSRKSAALVRKAA